jgi:cobalamin-dependent methionine synthase I
MLQDIAPGAKSIVGLSNVSNGAPNHLRPYLNRTYLMMLMKYDIYSVILDAFDRELLEIARGKRPELVQLVHQAMTGEKIDMKSLSLEDIKYVKTVKVLLGEVLYSHSWLET